MRCSPSALQRRVEYKQDDHIVYTEDEKRLIGKKIEKKEGKANYIQRASKRPNVAVLMDGKRTGGICLACESKNGASFRVGLKARKHTMSLENALLST